MKKTNLINRENINQKIFAAPLQMPKRVVSIGIQIVDMFK